MFCLCLGTKRARTRFHISNASAGNTQTASCQLRWGGVLTVTQRRRQQLERYSVMVQLPITNNHGRFHILCGSHKMWKRPWPTLRWYLVICLGGLSHNVSVSGPKREGFGCWNFHQSTGHSVIRSSHDGRSADFCLPECDAAQSGRKKQRFEGIYCSPFSAEKQAARLTDRPADEVNEGRSTPLRSSKRISKAGTWNSALSIWRDGEVKLMGLVSVCVWGWTSWRVRGNKWQLVLWNEDNGWMTSGSRTRGSCDHSGWGSHL